MMLFHLLWRMGAFLCQHEASKIKNTIVRNFFSAVVYTACNITHTIEKPIAVLSVSSENIFRWFYMKEHHWLCTTEIYTLLPKTALPTAQSSFTKSNDGTGSVCKREKFDQFDISWNYVYKYPVYDIVSMAKRFHIGFYAKCKKCDEMYMGCICSLEEEAFWANSWQNQQNDFCAQRRLRSAWASAQSDQSLRCGLNG